MSKVPLPNGNIKKLKKKLNKQKARRAYYHFTQFIHNLEYENMENPKEIGQILNSVFTASTGYYPIIAKRL